MLSFLWNHRQNQLPTGQGQSNAHYTSRGGSGNKPGVTLIELLIVILISVIVVGAAITAYKVNITYYLKTDALLTRNQNLRTAMYAITRDVRMAGNSLILMGPRIKMIHAYVPGQEVLDISGKPVRSNVAGWFKHADISSSAPADEFGARAVFGVDGGENDPDTLTIFRAEVEYGAPLGQISATVASSDTVEIILKSAFPDGMLRANDMVVLVDGETATLLETSGGMLEPGTAIPSATSFSVKLKGRFTPPDASAINFTEGASIYNLRDVIMVTYYIDQQNNRLMADYHDVNVTDPVSGQPSPVVVADNIEDMQIFYFYNTQAVDLKNTGNSPNISSAALQTNRVRTVAIGLTACSDYGSAADGKNQKRPALFNHKEGTIIDRKYRSTMIELVYLRNAI